MIVQASARGPEVQGHRQLHSEFEASLEYVRCCLKKKKSTSSQSSTTDSFYIQQGFTITLKLVPRLAEMWVSKWTLEETKR